MKLPNCFKILWWGALLIALSYGVSVRFDAYKSGDVTGMDALVLLVWLALALVPVFKEVEFFGVKFRQGEKSLNPQPHLDTEKDKVSSLSNIKVQEAFNDPLTLEQVNVLKTALADVEPKEEILYKLLAENQIAVVFEQTYSLIFGSQLSALQHMNGLAGTQKELAVLKPFYENAKEKYPDFYKNYPYESWLNFLLSSLLILVDDGNIDITVRGQAFLNYLTKQRYSLEKGG